MRSSLLVTSSLALTLATAACGGPERPKAEPDAAGLPRLAARSGGPVRTLDRAASDPAEAPVPGPAEPIVPAVPAIAPDDPKLRADLRPLPRFGEQRAVVDHALAAVHAVPDAASALAALARVRTDDAAILARGAAFAAHREAFVAEVGARQATLAESAIDAAATADKARWTEPVVAAAKALARDTFGRGAAPAVLPPPPPVTEEELALVADLQVRRCRLATQILANPKSAAHIDATIEAFQKSDGARVLELRRVEQAALGIRDNESRGDAPDVDHFAANDPALDHARRVWRACDGLVRQLSGAWNPNLPAAKRLYLPAMVQVWLPFEVPN